MSNISIKKSPSNKGILIGRGDVIRRSAAEERSDARPFAQEKWRVFVLRMIITYNKPIG